MTGAQPPGDSGKTTVEYLPGRRMEIWSSRGFQDAPPRTSPTPWRPAASQETPLSRRLPG